MTIAGVIIIKVGGILTDADSTPVAGDTRVFKNGLDTLQQVTVTKRAGTTGIYDWSGTISGTTAGDILRVEVDLTVQGETQLYTSSNIIVPVVYPANFATLNISASGVVRANDASGNALATAQQVAAIQVTDTGAGNIRVDHDTGGTDAIRIVAGGVGVDQAEITAYLAADYAARQMTKRGRTVTGTDGRWVRPMFLNAGSYKLVVTSPGKEDLFIDLEVS